MTDSGAVPAADVGVEVELVRALLTEQAPQLASLPLVPAAEGWDNVMIRAGEDLVVRLPRRRSAAGLLVNEVTWAGALAPRLPLPIPVPSFVGAPGLGYPYPWAVTQWLPGAPAAGFPVAGRDGYVVQFAGFLAAFHRPVAPSPGAGALPVNPVRGVAVAERSGVWRDRLARASAQLPPGAVGVLESMIGAAEAAPAWGRESVWIHGDPHPLNVLAEGGDQASGNEGGRGAVRLSAVVDLGDLTLGDPASDLGAAWLHFTRDGLRTFRAEYAARALADDDALWARAGGWAVNYLLSLLGDDSLLGVAAREAVAGLLRGPDPL